MRYLVAVTVIGALASVGSVQAGGEIHGTISTEAGEEFTGAIRWDRNENFWDDVLDARKEDVVYTREGGVTVYLFGKKIIDVDDDNRVHPVFSIPFGHIRSLRPVSGRRAKLILKNGEVIKIVSNNSDIGNSIRDVVILDGKKGKTSLDWDEIEKIRFSAGSGTVRDAERLYGTVDTPAGPFTGFIVWDMDEAMFEDILDGEEDGVDREIPFGDIRIIEKVDQRSCRIHLQDGKKVNLEGTNDVNSGNRGIFVTIPGLGRVRVSWGQFQQVRFEPAPRSPTYGEFDGGWKLSGTVTTSDGSLHQGMIHWDRDESYSWEFLDGRADRIKYAILFENIESIRRLSSRSAEVQLRNGTVLTLTGSNDVNSGNKGIRVFPPDGEEVEIS
ncbi:MAG: hypothetical protein V3T54_03895, partial [Acidobacteriota bacterium]